MVQRQYPQGRAQRELRVSVQTGPQAELTGKMKELNGERIKFYTLSFAFAVPL